MKKSDIQRLAEVDEFEVVRTVHEFYGDYLAVHPDLFSFNLTYPHYPLFGESPSLWDANTFQRTVEGLVSVLLSLKKKPLIRYEKNSPLAKRLGGEIHVGLLRIDFFDVYSIKFNKSNNFLIFEEQNLPPFFYYWIEKMIR